MLTISSWHKYHWFSMCAVKDGRGFSNHFGGHRLHISPSTTESCNKLAMKHTTWALQTIRIEVKAGLDQVLQNSPVTGMPAEGLLCIKLLSPVLGSGFAANQRESPQIANTQVQDLTTTAAIPKEGNTGHGNNPHVGEELQECRTISCPWAEVSSSLWGGKTSPVSCQRTAETHKPHHPGSSYSKHSQQPILTVCICTHNAGVFPSQL